MTDQQPNRRRHGVTFTAVELDHLLAVLRDAEAQGIYYGNREQYWKRHQRIVDKLEAEAQP